MSIPLVFCWTYTLGLVQPLPGCWLVAYLKVEQLGSPNPMEKGSHLLPPKNHQSIEKSGKSSSKALFSGSMLVFQGVYIYIWVTTPKNEVRTVGSHCDNPTEIITTIHPSITDQHQLRQGPKMFQGRKVLVVGAGLGLAGLVCASCTKAQEASGLELGVWKEKKSVWLFFSKRYTPGKSTCLT